MIRRVASKATPGSRNGTTLSNGTALSLLVVIPALDHPTHDLDVLL
jgi:hypothetical protein